MIFSGIETAEGQAEAVPEKGANNTQAAKKTLWETYNCDNYCTCPKVILTTLSPLPLKKIILLHYCVNI